MKLRFSWILAFFFAVGFLESSLVQAQEVKVLVLDALSGKPEAGATIQYLCAGTKENSATSAPVVTNSDGYVRVTITCSDKEKVQLWVLPRHPKEQCGDLDLFTAKDVLANGVLADPTAAGNIWCPKKVSKKMKPAPGQITVFVKKPTWFQSHIAG